MGDILCGTSVYIAKLEDSATNLAMFLGWQWPDRAVVRSLCLLLAVKTWREGGRGGRERGREGEGRERERGRRGGGFMLIPENNANQ